MEKIKKIIEREWATTIDRTAELAVKTIEKQWQASVSSSSANKDFYEELGKIMTSSRKHITIWNFILIHHFLCHLMEISI